MGDEFRAESLLSTVGVDWDTKAIVVDGVNVTMKIWVRSHRTRLKLKRATLLSFDALPSTLALTSQHHVRNL